MSIRNAWPLLLSFAACAFAQPGLSEAQKKVIQDLKADLQYTESEILDARAKDKEVVGGLVKSLIAVRLEVLKTNRELINQRIHAIQSGTPVTYVTVESKTNPEKTAEILSEIQEQKRKVAEAVDRSSRYTGGLVKALHESTTATAQQTLAMLEQQYFLSKYGLALPAAKEESQVTAQPVRSAESRPEPKAPSKRDRAEKCLELENIGSSVLDANSVFAEVAWKADVRNSCDEGFVVEVRFVLSDANEFELDSRSETVAVSPNEVAKARGKMLVSPPEKARRIAKQGASLRLRQ